MQVNPANERMLGGGGADGGNDFTDLSAMTCSFDFL